MVALTQTQPQSTTDTPLQVRYASNLTAGDSVINITNTGAHGNSMYGPGFGGASGNICINVYAFSPDEQLVSCCSCLVTPNGLVNLSANNDLVSNTLTGVRPNSIVIKLLTTATGAGPTFTGSTCTNSAALANLSPSSPFPIPTVGGMIAWGTTLHSTITPAAAPYTLTETQFAPSTIDAGELASMTNRCANIIGNGSSFGICRSCRLGGLGGARL